MTKTEFLEELKHALGNDLPEAEVNDNVNYYSQYIAEEAANGRSESEILDELGDPWAIARNIINGYTHKTGMEVEYERSYKGFGSTSVSAGRDYDEDDSEGAEYDADDRSESGSGYNSGNSYNENYEEGSSGGSDFKAFFIKAAIIVVVLLVIFGICCVLGMVVQFFLPLIIVFIVYKIIKTLFFNK